jgi:queuine tRNA-ribosyltransferase
MTAPVWWAQTAIDGSARAGVLHTPHGQVLTPGFMPVGTRAAVRGVDVDDLANVGTEMVLANTYHLMLRPGAATVAQIGGLHAFWGWPGPILTDSGGYQIFSLSPRITEAGAEFRSTYDGSAVSLSPEDAVRIQEELGPDIAMVLDVCVGLPAAPEVVRRGMEITSRWAERSLRQHQRADQALFGIVQGGIDPDLRGESARATAGLGFDGFGIGGLSVGETPVDRAIALDAALGELPPGKPRYVMGLGDPSGVLDAVARGADLFDCVWPTRLARHGRVLTPAGDFNLRRAEYRSDPEPLQPGCPCFACQTHNRAYLRHLLAANELSAFRLLSIHNLHYTLSLLRDARQSILAGTFGDFTAAITAIRNG